MSSSKVNSIRAKLKSKLPTHADNKKHLKCACSTTSTTVTVLETTLKFFKEGAVGVGPPGLQAGIGGLLFVIAIIKVFRITVLQ
jgi:hypothetical protein